MSSEVCAGCGRKHFRAAAGAIYIRADGTAVGYTLCSRCTAEHRKDSAAVSERVELRLDAAKGTA